MSKQQTQFKNFLELDDSKKLSCKRIPRLNIKVYNLKVWYRVC